MEYPCDERLDTIALLQAMYPLDGEISLSPSTLRYIDNPASAPPDYLEVDLSIALEDDTDKLITVCITLSSSLVKIVPRHPPWLNRTAYEALQASVVSQEAGVSSSEYILETIEMIKASAAILRENSQQNEEVVGELADETQERLERVWFWFPMLSTREKRKDLVQYAPQYGLTGFVLAGKPALLCLEGDGRKVEKYMSDIKSISWSDVPSFQKKVTERFRRTLEPGQRAFKEMTDITNEITHYGQYNHRGDMGDVRRLMEKWGVGDDFGAAVLNSNA